MGNSVSTPLALDERNSAFIRKPELTHKLYTEHVDGNVSSPDLLYQVPDELMSKVSLHQAVDLSFNLITELPLDLPLSLPHLKMLSLSHNRIATIPDSIFGFLHMEHLDLSFNRIEVLPTGICLLNKLKKLNLSNNQLKKLPSNIDQLASLEKINLISNQLTHLPISLGNIPSLQVVLVLDNPLISTGDENGLTSSSQLLEHLRSCYARSVSPTSPMSLNNSFNRIRGSVFDSRVLNAGSAQSLFGQMQAQAVNTGNRLLTPMIPPTTATTLDAERLRDAILGMFYGAVIGDSLGLLTDFMSPSEAEFHYNNEDLNQKQMHQDEHRSRYSVGQVSPASHLLVLVLESVLKWAGVVDELDYTERLASWYDDFQESISSHVLEGIMNNRDGFLSSPTTTAREYKDAVGQEKENLYLVVDNMCLPPIVGLVISQFHDLDEVKGNARRICGSTHDHEDNRNLSVILAEILAKLLQGETLEKVIDGVELGDWNKADISHPATSMDMILKHVETSNSLGFRAAMTEIVMSGGHASINGVVAGSVFGLVEGFQSMPAVWVTSVDLEFRRNLDKKLNLLFDLMGVP
eukprot:GFUD01032756.1.p1 GENE.GFUD01032756.1~~GFUD01032756.1.p1  ORF type:complete len:578 (+),score=117.79 GFUD01032756.1:138-1871(+)